MSAAPTRVGISQALLGAALVSATAVLAFRSGGFFDQPRTTIAVGAWLLVAATALVRPGWLAPPGRAGRVALAGLLALAGWTALSISWAPLLEPAREDAVRLALYAAALPLACVAFRERGAARALEVALAALALAVVGYGLLGRLGAFDVTVSASADGRLDQPLGYWNAMGVMAAVGLVLCVRIAVDGARRHAIRGMATGAALPLAAGLYLTYSRGAVAAALLGLVVVAVAAPEMRPLWRRAPAAARPAVAWATIALAIAAIGVVAGDRASPPARGATAERFTDIGSNRADYWRVAVDSVAAEPLRGGGTSSFAVAWLRERNVHEGARDAHSLYLETVAELGVVGLVALLAFVAGSAAALRRLVRLDPALGAGPAAAAAALALHAAIDWDWELPAVALPALLLVGMATARERSRGAGTAPSATPSGAVA